jgi:hypothetical protein
MTPPPSSSVPSDFAGVSPNVPSGIEFGARLGYALPLGNLTGDAASTISNSINGAVPIFIEAGYRIARPNLYLGIYFSYAPGLLNTSNQNSLFGGCSQNGVSCSANVVMYGAQVHYHIMPEANFDPWIGAGIGMESINGSGSGGGTSTGASFSGWDYLLLQVGGDYRAAPMFGIGPVAWFGIGQFGNVSGTTNGNTTSASINNTGLHEWLAIGVRGVLDFPVGH